jgi:hypothetical protein
MVKRILNDSLQLYEARVLIIDNAAGIGESVSISTIIKAVMRFLIWIMSGKIDGTMTHWINLYPCKIRIFTKIILRPVDYYGACRRQAATLSISSRVRKFFPREQSDATMAPHR